MPYRDQVLLCVCGTRLSRRRYRAYSIRTCDQCQAAWVHPDHLERMLQLLVPAGVERPVLRKDRSSPGGSDRGCPECRKPMQRFYVGSQLIDECPHHGYWFDCGELYQVLLELALDP